MTNATDERKEIEKNVLFQEICSCKQIQQYLSDIYKKENEAILLEAKHFFNDFYIYLVDYLLLKIIRLFDPAKTNNNENFSFEKLLSNQIADPKSVDELKKQFEIIKRHISKLKDYRCKHLAHLDYKKTISTNSHDLEKLKNEATICLSLLEEFYRAIINEDEKADIDIQFACFLSPASVDIINLLVLGTYVWKNRNEPEIRKIITKMTTERFLTTTHK